MEPVSAEGRSLIPCLEPCAVFMEFARKAVRVSQEEPMDWRLAPSDADTLEAAVELALACGDASHREADFSAPANDRRLRWVLSKLKQIPRPLSDKSQD